MIYEFEPLTREEQEMMLKAPALIAILIAGADDHIDQSELNKAIELANVKSFSEKLDIQPYYQQVEKTIAQDIEDAMAVLPGDAAGRGEVISGELAKLNALMPRLKNKFARDLYASWKNFAHTVARSWGGVLGVNTISAHEKQWIDLPMLTEPAQAE